MVLTGDGLGNTEVRHLHECFRGDQNVARLDVAVHDALTVSVGQRRRGLGCELRTALGGQCSSTAENFGQGLPLDQLHHNEVGAVVLAPVEDGHDVGVRQIGRGLRFATEAFHKRRVGAELGIENLEGHRSIQ